MSDRKLPSKRNHLVIPVKDELQKKELIARRRLGQTELAVDAGQVGTSNATKLKNLGVFDYAHIRVPLPKDLKGSGIFHASRGKSTPEAYFLMRRSSDGFVSASGMFKVAFPWASDAEEKAEKAHLAKLPGTSKEETAGNVWVTPDSALALSDEYDIRDWILVLLDPTPILNEGKKSVKSPPVYHPAPISPARSTRAKTPVKDTTPSLAPPEPESPESLSPRKRALRSASPTKEDPPKRKMATPKPRTKRGRTPAASASAEPEEKTSSEPATTTKRKASGRAKKEASAAPEETGPSPLQTLETKGKAVLDNAKQAIDNAMSLSAQPAKEIKSRKRKAADISDDVESGAEKELSHAKQAVADKVEDFKQGAADKVDELKQGAVQARETFDHVIERVTGHDGANKRRRVADIEVRKDRVRRRAAVGIAAGLVVGAVAPLVTSFLGW